MGCAEIFGISMISIYLLFYFSFFIAFTVCVAILEDDNDCREIKKFGIGQLVADIFLAFLLCLINTLGDKWFITVWFFVNGSFHMAALIIYNGSNCTQTLRGLLLVNIYACIAPTAISAIIFWFQCCCKDGGGVYPLKTEPPKKKKWIQKMMPVWHEETE